MHRYRAFYLELSHIVVKAEEGIHSLTRVEREKSRVYAEAFKPPCVFAESVGHSPHVVLAHAFPKPEIEIPRVVDVSSV